MQIEELKMIMLEIAGIVEKYPDTLQEKVFDIMTENIFGKKSQGNNHNAIISTQKTDDLVKKVITASDNGSSNDNTSKKSKKKTSSKDTYQINKDLNLSPKDKKTLKEFVDEKKPKSNIEFNVVAVYYLEKIIGKEEISIDDVYTCYKNVNKKVPAALKQSLTDTSSSKYGYISVTNCFYSIPVAGENFIEFDLPKENKEA